MANPKATLNTTMNYAWDDERSECELSISYTVSGHNFEITKISGDNDIPDELWGDVEERVAEYVAEIAPEEYAEWLDARDDYIFEQSMTRDDL